MRFQLLGSLWYSSGVGLALETLQIREEFEAESQKHAKIRAKRVVGGYSKRFRRFDGFGISAELAILDLVWKYDYQADSGDHLQFATGQKVAVLAN